MDSRDYKKLLGENDTEGSLDIRRFASEIRDPKAGSLDISSDFGCIPSFGTAFLVPLLVSLLSGEPCRNKNQDELPDFPSKSAVSFFGGSSLPCGGQVPTSQDSPCLKPGSMPHGELSGVQCLRTKCEASEPRYP